MQEVSHHKTVPTVQKALAERTKSLAGKLLAEARVYLSGPMDFVASRAEEKRNGWRTRVGEFLTKRFRTTVYDPWNKPEVMGMPHYGKEDEFSARRRENWTFEDTEEGARARAQLSAQFWPTLHIDLRMVDTSDFLIAYTPTNVYSVGTAHEIALARQQYKPVLLVSPPVDGTVLEELRAHLGKKADTRALELLARLEAEASLKPNPGAIPSLWYMALLDGSYFFDGFGFGPYLQEFGWERGPLDEREARNPPKRPLLPYLDALNESIPKRWDLEQDKYVENADWLIFDQPDRP
ncbi:hypothetical protein D187_007316 [Cystobacter fuscus DSM 2262]|uniref:Uncharacterized protein n=1 Tax=Cystobacter fuscus (strain ATCC 25194 / DSM 2262 / NBRC 100088 / M29) TaxID=1242864 RepID=S9NXC4_CYSF2|nr:hypothetical protein [Cystobacter fuscus]EPX56880.1 hypothetical protein D187_007316 [Cystobacter fuscus DSM 2262]